MAGVVTIDMQGVEGTFNTVVRGQKLSLRLGGCVGSGSFPHDDGVSFAHSGISFHEDSCRPERSRVYMTKFRLNQTHDGKTIAYLEYQLKGIGTGRSRVHPAHNNQYSRRVHYFTHTLTKSTCISPVTYLPRSDSAPSDVPLVFPFNDEKIPAKLHAPSPLDLPISVLSVFVPEVRGSAG